jgi:hypothetical protein
LNWEYATDLAIGTALIWLGLHYGAGWEPRTAFIVGLTIIGLTIAAQNARFAVDSVNRFLAWRRRKQ